ncbi:elongation factor 1-beta [archaeon]|jgi:elongation factor 1-beta|nr:elongation factor 1-beta [archaeon]
MAGINGAKYKLMPTSPDVDLETIKDTAKKIVEEFGGENKEYTEEPIAFGLKSITVFFYYPDDKDTEKLEEKFAGIENVASAQLIDMRKIV